MNKYQEAYSYIKHYCELDDDFLKWPLAERSMTAFKELVDKATPKKLKNKTDKDGRLLLVCPTCGDVYMKFWSDVETVSCREYCDECGQKLDWSDE